MKKLNIKSQTYNEGEEWIVWCTIEMVYNGTILYTAKFISST